MNDAKYRVILFLVLANLVFQLYVLSPDKGTFILFFTMMGLAIISSLEVVWQSLGFKVVKK